MFNLCERTTKNYIRHLFKCISYSQPEFVEYVLDNDYEMPEYIKTLCYRFFEEWNIDAQSLTLNKPSVITYLQIAKYYGI